MLLVRCERVAVAIACRSKVRIVALFAVRLTYNSHHPLAGMVWYGLVWYGMVWYGMVWYGMVWYGLVEACLGEPTPCRVATESHIDCT
jgi:hypothetical protein